MCLRNFGIGLYLKTNNMNKLLRSFLITIGILLSVVVVIIGVVYTMTLNPWAPFVVLAVIVFLYFWKLVYKDLK
jgi:hypothetical protein